MGPKFLVVGCGSIGERHVRVFQHATRYEISICETRSDRIEHMQREYAIDKAYSSIDEVDLTEYGAVAVCTPTHTHIPIATAAVEAGCHVFLEKPLSTSLAGVDTLFRMVTERGVVLQVGYVMRSHPGLRQVKEWVDTGEIGEIVAARVKVGYYVPQYRPDYRDTYWAKSETGGGVILDASHQLDYIQWLLGVPEEVSCFATHAGDLEVEEDVEDIATMILRFPGDVLADLHFNHLQRNYTHNLELIGRHGTITWSYDENEVAIYRSNGHEWERRDFELERDDMYEAQAASFAAAVRGDAPPRVTGADGLRALRLALAALQSARTRAVVRIEDGDEA